MTTELLEFSRIVEEDSMLIHYVLLHDADETFETVTITFGAFYAPVVDLPC